MRYALQLFVMTFDVALLAACVAILRDNRDNVFTWIIVGGTVWVWIGQGAFMAWQPSVIKRFMKNAKKLGL